MRHSVTSLARTPRSALVHAVTVAVSAMFLCSMHQVSRDVANPPIRDHPYSEREGTMGLISRPTMSQVAEILTVLVRSSGATRS